MEKNGNAIYALYGKAYESTNLISGIRNNNSWSWKTQEIGDHDFLRSLYLLSDGTFYFGGDSKSYIKPQNSALLDLGESYENFNYANIEAINAIPDKNIMLLGGDDADDDGAWLFLGNDNSQHKTNWIEPHLNACTPDNIGPANINSMATSEMGIYLGVSNFYDPHASGICTSNDLGKTWDSLNNFPETELTLT